MTVALRDRSGAGVAGDRRAGAGALAAPVPDAGARMRLWVLVLALPMFGQTFHYMKDLPPLWALSKAFPVLSLPLVLALLWRQGLPRDVHYWLAAFTWLLVVPSITAIFAFDQSFIIGLTAQVKLLGMLHALSFLGLLLVLRPSLDELARAFAILAGVIGGALVLLWAFAPQSWYATGYEFGDAPLLSADDRGNRIRMPLQFLLVGLFLAYRRFLGRLDGGAIGWRDLALVIAGVLLVVFLVKTRAFIVALAAGLMVISFLALGRRGRIVAAGAAGLGALGLVQLPYIQAMFDLGAGSGFDLRARTIDLAIGFLGTDPGRWIFGVGTISPLEPDGLARFFNHFFFLADISWLGVVFEYGLVGAGIILGLMVRTWWLGRQVSGRINHPFCAALHDHVLFVMLASPLYSTMTLQPGEVAMIAAILIYASMVAGQIPPARLRRAVPASPASPAAPAAHVAPAAPAAHVAHVA